MIARPLASLQNTANSRPAGYLEDCLAVGALSHDGLTVLFTKEQYEALASKYRPHRTARRQDPAVSRKSSPTQAARSACLVGTELKALLKKWLGIEASPTCGCNAMAANMDAWGCDECAKPERVTEVVNWMRAEHGRRAKAGRIHVPWSDLAAATMIRLAIRQARKKQAKAARS